MKAKIAREAIMLLHWGRIIFVKVLRYPAPSIIAASQHSSGIPLIYCLKSTTPKAENPPGRITERNEPIISSFLNNI